MFKTLKLIGSRIDSGLDKVNTTLNKMNDGLQSFNESMKNSAERSALFRTLAREVYDNKINREIALNQILEKIGSEYFTEFDNFLENYCEIECKEIAYKIFPLKRPVGKIEQYFLENNETLFAQYLMARYGNLYLRYFQVALEERKKWLIDYLEKIDNLSSYRNLNNDELNTAYWNKSEEIGRYVNSDEFQKLWKELTGDKL